MAHIQSGLATSVFLAMIAGCGAASTVRPAEPQVPYGSYISASAVPAVDSMTAPFVVGWEPAQVAALQAEMERGGQVAVVRFDQSGIETLTNCGLPGGYEFLTLAPYRATIDIADSGSSWVGAGPYGGANAGTAAGAAFDHVIAGKRRAVRSSARRSELRGDCARATHFVYGAYTGAFRKLTGTSAQIGANAHMASVGGGSEGSSIAQYAALGGNPDECLTPGAASSPRCGALIRIELVAISVSLISTVELVGLTVQGSKPNGSLWDADNSPPDVLVQFSTASGQRGSVVGPRDTGVWNNTLPLGSFEVLPNSSLIITAVDKDILDDDLIGSCTLTPNDLLANGYVRKELSNQGYTTGSVVLRVAVSTGP